MLIIFGVCFVPSFLIGRFCSSVVRGYYKGYDWRLPRYRY